MNTETTVTGQQLDSSNLQRDPTPYELEVLKREQQSISIESARGSCVDDGSVVEGCGISQ
ncbi:MAG TPA: hypothetical protein VIJ38_00200 [Acidobacteriaceae bacterium]